MKLDSTEAEVIQVCEKFKKFPRNNFKGIESEKVEQNAYIKVILTISVYFRILKKISKYSSQGKNKETTFQYFLDFKKKKKIEILRRKIRTRTSH